MSVNVQITTLPEIERKLKALAPGLRSIAIEASEDMVFEADRLAKEHVIDKSRKPVNRQGVLLSSIHPFIKKATAKLTGAIRASAKYAKALEDGSKPHVIEPRNKKALFWPGAAHPVKKVNHPGNPAYNFLKGARDDVLDRLDEFTKAAFARWVKRRGI